MSDEIDWTKPLEVSRGMILPVTLDSDEGDCKWLKVGYGIYMFNNDGTAVDCGVHVRNVKEETSK